MYLSRRLTLSVCAGDPVSPIRSGHWSMQRGRCRRNELVGTAPSTSDRTCSTRERRSRVACDQVRSIIALFLRRKVIDLHVLQLFSLSPRPAQGETAHAYGSPSQGCYTDPDSRMLYCRTSGWTSIAPTRAPFLGTCVSVRREAG